MSAKLRTIILIAILVVGLGLRLYKIGNPIADWHSWRQADTSSVTRNFVKYGVDIFTPRYDDFSDVSGNGFFNSHGYRMVEFPIFNVAHYFFYFLVSSFYSLEQAGRLTSALAAVVSGGLIYFIVRKHFSEITALLAAAIYLFLPYNIYFTRVILPDPLMTSLVLAALLAHIYKRRISTWIFASLAMLVKPTAVFFLLPILSDYRIFLAALIPTLLWRAWEQRFPAGIPANIWLLNGNHIRFKPSWFRWLFGERIGGMILGTWGIFPFLQGLLVQGNYFLWWTLGGLLYFIVFATGNIQHDYYQIPIIPIISILVAIGATRFAQTLAKKILITICLTFMLAFSWYDIKGDYQINHYDIINAGQATNRLTPPDAVVITPYNGDTAFLYQTNRRGFPYTVLPIKDMIDRYGATYYISVNYDAQTREVMNKYTIVEENPGFVIVRLEEPHRD